MIQKLKMLILASASLFLLGAPAVVMAVDTPAPSEQLCSGGTTLKIDGGGTCSNVSGGTSSLNDKIAKVINLLSVIVGVIAVIMIIVGGFRYITSGGKQESVTSAKNTILYAIIGLIIVALAQIIVKFVLEKSTTGNS